MPCYAFVVLFPLAALATSSAYAVAFQRRADVAITEFSTPQQIAQLRWDAITDLHQCINGIIVSGGGKVTAANPDTWPMKSLITAAHGNSSNILVPVHMTNKPAAAAFLSSPVNSKLLSSAAEMVVSLAIEAGYDGISIDIEGLKPESKAGLEAFVKACAAELRGKSPNKKLLVTIYAPKLLKANSILTSAYNISRLSKIADFVFIMGYDMTWLGAKGGSGATEAGPNSPLNGLSLALENSIRWGAAPQSLILGLPLYGDLYTCDGTSVPEFGNCSTTVKKMKKSVDILAAAATGDGCTTGFNTDAASPFFDCRHGTSIPGSGSEGVRQQGWFENLRSIAAKLGLADQRRLGGIGLWTGSGVANTGAGRRIWEAVAEYVRGTK